MTAANSKSQGSETCVTGGEKKKIKKINGYVQYKGQTWEELTSLKSHISRYSASYLNPKKSVVV